MLPNTDIFFFFEIILLEIVQALLAPPVHRYVQHKVWPIFTDVVWFVCVCLLVTSISCAKTDEPIKILFSVWTREPKKPRFKWAPGFYHGKGRLAWYLGMPILSYNWYSQPYSLAAMRPLVVSQL